MSTVSNRPVSFQSRQCIGCGAALFISPAVVTPLCRECQRGQILFDIHRMLGEIRDLRAGKGLYALLTTEERSEQLTALGLPPVEAKPLYPGFRAMDSDRLIRIVSGEDLFTLPGEDPNTAVGEALVELCRRLDAPSPEVREEIEIRDEIEIIEIGDSDTHADIERRLATLDAIDELTPEEQQAYAGIHEGDRFDGLA